MASERTAEVGTGPVEGGLVDEGSPRAGNEMNEVASAMKESGERIRGKCRRSVRWSQ